METILNFFTGVIELAVVAFVFVFAFLVIGSMRHSRKKG